jgi:cyanate permease
MSQSRRHSALEAAVNVAVGYLLALATQILVFPLFDIHITFSSNLGISVVFTVLSLVRGYALRRAFNWWHTRSTGRSKATA